METPKPIETTYGEKGKFSCPKCNSTRVVEETDKSRVIYMAASTPIYAKKKRCLKCNYSWAV
jgi:predicted nucleic-acid-binding Zn-ribbon protein